MLSTENIVSDGFYGCCVVTCTLCAFISLVWLREQIMRGGGPEWLDQQDQIQNAVAQIQNAGHAQEVNPLLNDNNNDEGIGDEEEEEENVEDIVEEQGDANQEAPAILENEAEGNADAGNANNALAAAQDWNPAIEWDRAAEELTWERVC